MSLAGKRTRMRGDIHMVLGIGMGLKDGLRSRFLRLHPML
jgi:hypothetical protein